MAHGMLQDGLPAGVGVGWEGLVYLVLRISGDFCVLGLTKKSLLGIYFFLGFWTANLSLG